MSGPTFARLGPGDLPEPTNHPNSPSYDSDIDDRIGERTDELVAERMSDMTFVARVIDELLATSDVNSDGNSHIAADMALVLDSSDAALASNALHFFIKLRRQVTAVVDSGAQSDAEGEIAREIEASEIMRYEQRGDML